MKSGARRIPWLVIAALAIGDFDAPASAADFYKGKTVNILISASAGTSYDVFARLLGRHIGDHIPGNPHTIAQNMDGAGGMTLLNHAYNIAAQDGTVIFTLHQNLPMYQRMGASGVHYDVRKIRSIGRLSAGNELLLAHPRSGVKGYRDLYEREVIVGGTGATSNSVIYPTLSRSMLGLKFKVISGYKSITEAQLAMDRGEVEGMGSITLGSVYATAPDFLKPGVIVPIVQFGFNREPEWPDAPTAIELAKTDADRRALEIVSVGPEIGRSYWVGPKVPEDRVNILRRAFDNMVKDETFLREFRQQNMLERFATGEQMTAYVQRIFDAPDSVIDHLRSAMPRPK